MADGYLNFDTKINESGFNEGINKLGSLGKSGLSVVSKAMTGVVAVVGTGAAAIVKSSLGVVANMEQQVGGVETLFKDSAKTVIRNANNAFKTAQLSANDYMSTVTSFSASLLQGLGGDTAKAAEIADMAIIDMADNANKMGTNMQDIQNAYQGFAKKNYTMLDNLKLGYGGTQSEMIRLINDSGILNEKIEDLDNVTFDQMIQAIHKVQQNLGITGTSAKEASTTIEGSVNSAKAAWENFEAGVISANDLVDTFWTAAKNILNNLGQMIPRLGKTGMDVVESLSGKIGEAVPQLKGLTDSVGKLADRLKNMSTDELMNLGKTAAVLAGAGPVISLFGSQIGNVQSAVSGFSGLTTGVLSELGKLPKGFKSATKSAANFRKDFTGSLKGLGSAVTGPFQVLTPKLSATVGKIGKVVSSVPGKIGGAVGKIGSAIASKIPRITSAFSLLGDTAGYLGAWGGQIGSALHGVLGTVAGFIPSFVGLMNFGAVAAVVVAGLGLVYSQFGTQIDQILLLAQTKGPEIISNFGAGITAALPGLISSGATLILGLMNAITANLPSLISVGASIIATPELVWVVEATRQFFPQLEETAASGIDFQYDYPFDFAGEKRGIAAWDVDHIIPSEYRMIIYGPCVNPKILINDYPYEFFVTLESREYLIIDSQKRTIRRYLTNGTVQNLFNQRAQKQTVFERIPSGLLNVNWSGDYGFDLTLFLNRREPPW